MNDDDFEIRPGRIRDRSAGQSKERTLKAQLRALANRSGHGGWASDSGSPRGTGRHARGRIASLRASSRASQRRVAVKARIVRHSGSRFTAAPIAQHLTYLKRDGVTRDGLQKRERHFKWTRVHCRAHTALQHHLKHFCVRGLKSHNTFSISLV